MADENPNYPEPEDQDLDFYEWQHPVDYGGMPPTIEPPPDWVARDDPGLQRRRKLWLQTGQMWKEPLYPIYEGFKILSTSPDSLVGQWKANTRFGKKYIVVKQRRLTGLQQAPRPNLRDESQFYESMQSRLPPGANHHIVKMYRRAVVDEGKNTLSQDVGQVERMILESCETNFSQALRRRMKLSEREAWESFHCLARSLLIMNHGTEDPTHYRSDRPGFNAVDIVHFDLNPRNIYYARHPDPLHSLGFAVKPGSFRRATKLERRQDELYHRQFHQVGSVNSRAPEQLCASDMRELRPWLKDGRIDDRPGRGNTLGSVAYTSKTNVWQVGLIMFCIIHVVSEVDWNTIEAIRDRHTPTLQAGGHTIGSRTKREETLGYSRALISAIRECLLIEGSQRPNAAELFETTRSGLDRAVLAAGIAPQPPAQPPAQAPPQAPPPQQNLPEFDPLGVPPNWGLQAEPRLVHPPPPRRPPPQVPVQQQAPPPPHPNIIPADILDRRAVVEAEPDEELPAYQFHAPAGRVVPQPGWGGPLERPPPAYEDLPEYPGRRPDQVRPPPQRGPQRMGGIAQHIPRPPRRAVGAPPRVPPPPRYYSPPPLNLPVGFQPGPDDPHLIAGIHPTHLPSILVCHIIGDDLFGQQIGNIYLRDLGPDTAFFRIKGMLEEQGAGIERIDMRIRVDDGAEERELDDLERRNVLRDGQAVLVDNRYGMRVGEEGLRVGDFRGLGREPGGWDGVFGGEGWGGLFRRRVWLFLGKDVE
ncbi:hypothetical protein NHQ30_009153 [Ciborinia camelliae]|nr:hypothetical protein NHQ30_009153 [Ciborinia camelliae]